VARFGVKRLGKEGSTRGKLEKSSREERRERITSEIAVEDFISVHVYLVTK
jgi:hypothetical protein